LSVVELKAQPGPQSQFMEIKDNVPLVFYGGSAGGGKSWSLLVHALQFVDCPRFYGVFFRKTVKQLERTLWKEAKKIYGPFLRYQSGTKKGKFIGPAAIKEKDKLIIFPSGAMIEFSYLDADTTTEENWQGAELTAAYFDEFTHFSEFSFNYVRTRMRSDSKYDSFIRCSLNPHPVHFVRKYVDLFIDESTGMADKELAGKSAYFIFDHGELKTSFDKESLLEQYPNKDPREYSFIPSSLADNKKMLEHNKDYASNLEANDPANAAMLLSGNWNYLPAANGVWERSTVQVADKIPMGCSYYRSYDKAASKPAKEGGDSKQLDPDYTCSLLFAKDSDGFIYVAGNYRRDQEGKQIARYREKPGPRDKFIEKQAFYDGEDVRVILPKDPGQAGMSEFQESAKKLQQCGFVVIQDPSPSNKSKQLRFEPFAAACYTGNIYWVKSSFDPAVWDYMMLELENFNPLNKNNGFHDDLVDCCSTGYAVCSRHKVIPSFTLPTINAPTRFSQSGLSKR